MTDRSNKPTKYPPAVQPSTQCHCLMLTGETLFNLAMGSYTSQQESGAWEIIGALLRSYAIRRKN